MVDQNIGFTSTQVVRATGLTLRIVNYWASSGFLVPSVANPSGRGNRRRFSIPDVYAYAVLGELRNRGVSLQSLRIVQGFLRECDGLELQDARARLVLAPGSRRYAQDVALVHSDSEIISLLTLPGQQIAPVVVDVGALLKQVTARLNEIRREREARIAASKKRRAEKERNRAKRVRQRRAIKAA